MEYKDKEGRDLLVLNIILGFFGPCIVFSPGSYMLMMTSAVSALAHCALCGTVIGLEHQFGPEEEFWSQFYILITVMAWLVISLLASLGLDLLSNEQYRQKFGYATKLGSLSCDPEEAFLWACQRQDLFSSFIQPIILIYHKTLSKRR